jgi:hypothetical protein
MSGDFFGGVSNAVLGAVGGIQQVTNRISSVANQIGSSVSTISASINSIVGTDPNVLISRYRASGIPEGAEPNINFVPVTARFSESTEAKDWRVKINSPLIYSSPVLRPMADTGGMLFPYTPQITMTHSASYSTIDTVHNNFPFYAYKNSQIDEITIVGKFTVQTQAEAIYWLAVMHFLRTVTKMYFGQGPNLGNPPPICTLNGYGDFVYNNVAVVIKTFSINLPNEVDYIAANIATSTGGNDSQTSGTNVSYVPTSSEITVTLLPVFSREKIKSFNLEAFSQGQLIVGSDGKGFI